jgi:hypothetical protein
MAELENDSETSSEESEEGKKKKIKVKHISLDASGKRPLKKVPVFYTRRLSDMSRLTTDLTGSLLSYASMAINYSEMNKIVDALEIVKD